MKKYIIPALRIADINNETILAGSDPQVGFSSGDITDGANIDSRKRGLFDWTDDNEE